jgi:integrase
VTLLDHVERPSSADEKPKRILAGDELRRLLAAIDPDHRLIFETAAETGTRLAETLGIVWREVDLDAETITLGHQLDRHGARIPLKTKRSRRTIEVTPSLIAKLREHKLAGGPHDLVFVTRVGTPHDHRNVGGRVMARAVKRAGLKPSRTRSRRRPSTLYATPIPRRSSDQRPGDTGRVGASARRQSEQCRRRPATCRSAGGIPGSL